MNDIYTVPELYDAFHGNKVDDIPFLLAQAEKSKGPDVLELAAGTGRLAIPLIQAGFTYTGIELSPTYAQWARDKLTKRKLSGKIITGDMRSFSLDKKFDFIFIGFNSFLHLGTDQDALQCLEHIKKHLKPDGRFMVDIFVPNPDYLYRDPKKFYSVMTFDHPQGGECRIMEKTRYDSATEILHVEWFFYREEASSPDIYSFDMRMVYPDTLDRLITDAGLVIQEKLGNYDGSPLEPESLLQITIGCS